MVHRVLNSLPCENITMSSVKNMNKEFYAIENHDIFNNSVLFFFKLVKPRWSWILFDSKTASRI